MQTLKQMAEALYDALKDILNAADNGEAYTTEELESIFGPVLGQAREAGITGSGETPADAEISNHIATLNIGEDSLLFINGQLVASWQDGEFEFQVGLDKIYEVKFHHRHRIEDLPKDWNWKNVIDQLRLTERIVLGLPPKENIPHV